MLTTSHVLFSSSCVGEQVKTVLQSRPTVCLWEDETPMTVEHSDEKHQLNDELL